MADRPLRPAIHRRLGGPLPRQLANGPRTHPPAAPWRLSSPALVRGRSHPVLPHVSMGYPRPGGRLSTCYSPVRRSRGPKALAARLACLKRAASVRSEPGSNSPSFHPAICTPAYSSFESSPVASPHAAVRMRSNLTSFIQFLELTWKPLHFLGNNRCQRSDQQPYRVIVVSQSFLLFSHIFVKNLFSGQQSEV